MELPSTIRLDSVRTISGRSEAAAAAPGLGRNQITRVSRQSRDCRAAILHLRDWPLKLRQISHQFRDRTRHRLILHTVKRPVLRGKVLAVYEDDMLDTWTLLCFGFTPAHLRVQQACGGSSWNIPSRDPIIAGAR